MARVQKIRKKMARISPVYVTCVAAKIAAQAQNYVALQTLVKGGEWQHL